LNMEMARTKVFLVSLLVSVCLAAPYNASCVLQPSSPECSSYILPPNVLEADISALCGAMDSMPGCSVRKVCTSSSSPSNVKSSMYCDPFSVYKDLCLDMGKMNGCEDYRSMCSNVSVVQQCQTPALPLPSTMQGSDLVTSICNQMNMLSCSECMGSAFSRGLSLGMALLECDILQVYSDLCLSMPGMSECQAWATMCKAIPDWPFCKSGVGSFPLVPQMLMYFHGGYADYILFQNWVPQNIVQYTFSWFAIFAVTVFHEFIRMIRKKFERNCRNTSPRLVADSENSKISAVLPFSFAVDFPRAVLQALEAAWSLFVMLIAMTYNIGLFAAIVVGYFFGSLIFGRYSAAYDENSSINTGACH